jgi:hypothetical protein
MLSMQDFKNMLRDGQQLEATVVATGGIFVIKVVTDAGEFLLGGTRKGHLRRFSGLTSVPAFLLKLGIERFEVQIADYKAERVWARPDLAVAWRGRKAHKEEHRAVA